LHARIQADKKQAAPELAMLADGNMMVILDTTQVRLRPLRACLSSIHHTIIRTQPTSSSLANHPVIQP